MVELQNCFTLRALALGIIVFLFPRGQVNLSVLSLFENIQVLFFKDILFEVKEALRVHPAETRLTVYRRLSVSTTIV